MKDLIRALPEQLRTGAKLGTAARATKPFRSVISTGMGGSAAAGEILSMVRDDVVVHWDYDLPRGTSSADLVICTSWSGDTEETISSYHAARAVGADTLVITSGGALADLAHTDDTPIIMLPHVNDVPRTNVGLMTGAMFAALGLERQLPESWDASASEADGKALAEAIGDRMPVIYTSYPWRKLTGLWKMAYSETAKRQVMVNWFPSGAHNEIVGWEGPYAERVAFVLLRDSAEPPRYMHNFEALLALLPTKGYTVRTVGLSGNTLLEKVFTDYALALWTAYYAAIGLDVDPTATVLLDEFKKLKAHNT
ncbi:MAG TPA: SIS domain-containing protein [Candidatus Paceibacterota bacterium]|nr:SIS domain-containing protein [Candidatus Paceibacterota bacterium]